MYFLRFCYLLFSSLCSSFLCSPIPLSRLGAGPTLSRLGAGPIPLSRLGAKKSNTHISSSTHLPGSNPVIVNPVVSVCPCVGCSELPLNSDQSRKLAPHHTPTPHTPHTHTHTHTYHEPTHTRHTHTHTTHTHTHTRTHTDRQRAGEPPCCGRGGG